MTAGNASVAVSFADPFDGGSPITGYTAACASFDGGSPGSASGPSSPVVVFGLTNGRTYTCTVLASNGDGDGPVSTPSDPVVPNTVPDAPAPPTTAAADASIAVTFLTPFDGGSPITGFTAACTSSDGGAPGNAGSPASPITISGLTNAKTYTCTVLATNINGNGPASGDSAATVPNAVPDAPAPPTATPASTSIVVAFAAPSDGGSPITGYTATCTSSDGGDPGNASGPASPITVSGLTNAKTYTCTVLATNVNGDGPASGDSVPVMTSSVPDAPAAPSVTSGSTSITVTFVAPFDGGSPITGYTAACTSSDGGDPGSAAGPAAPVSVAGLTGAKTYTCTVLASNINGNGPASPDSAPVVTTTVPARPARPAAAAANARIVVSFAAPLNGGRPITAYHARCTSSDGGVTRVVAGAHSPITVTGLTNGARYTCTVLAINGNGYGPSSPSSPAVVPFGRGFRMFSGDGGVFGFGDSGWYGSAAAAARSLVISMAATRDNRGYWLTAQDGSVYAFGDARAYGSAAGFRHLPIVSIASTKSGKGYWLAATDGGIFGYGDARFYGSTGAIRLRSPIVGMTPTPTGHGYWLVAADGGVFGFGDARFFGSAAHRAVQRVVGLAATGTGLGYWIASADGQVFAFGDAHAFRFGPISGLRWQIMGISSTPTGRGYWLAGANGALFSAGDAPFIGWPGPLVLRRIIRGVSR